MSGSGRKLAAEVRREQERYEAAVAAKAAREAAAAADAAKKAEGQ